MKRRVKKAETDGAGRVRKNGIRGLIKKGIKGEDSQEGLKRKGIGMGKVWGRTQEGLKIKRIGLGKNEWGGTQEG